MAETGYHVLRENNGAILSSGIDVPLLASKLLEIEIIDEKDNREACNELRSENERLSSLMNTVRATVRGNDDVFFEFTDVLRRRNRKAEKDLAEKLEDQYYKSMYLFHIFTKIQ